MIDSSEMYQRALNEVKRHKLGNVVATFDEDSGDIILAADEWKLKVLINEKWVGYDFELDKKLTDGVLTGSSLDTDLYPLDFDVDVTREIFDETLLFVRSLLEDKIFYGVMGKRTVLAIPIDSTTYRVTLMNKRRFLATVTREEWSSEKVSKHASLRRLIALK